MKKLANLYREHERVLNQIIKLEEELNTSDIGDIYSGRNHVVSINIEIEKLKSTLEKIEREIDGVKEQPVRGNKASWE